MIISRDQVILGVLAPELRALLREIERAPMAERLIIDLAPGNDPRRLFDELQSERYIELAPPGVSSYRLHEDDEFGVSIWWTTVK